MPDALNLEGAGRNSPVLVTWESEVRAMAGDAVAWTTETGGDLFGVWGDRAVIYLVTRAGPGAVRDAAHFRLDVDYLRALSEELGVSWGLRYLGDWHSHHRLGLTAPSPGDLRRIARVAARNAFPGMAEIIVTLEDKNGLPVVARLHPWVYENGKVAQPKAASLMVVPGLSPVRDTLIVRNAFPEQEMRRWSETPAEYVVTDTARREAEDSGLAHLNDGLVEHLLADARRALEAASGSIVERHTAAFGAILAVPVDSTRLVGIAISREWPCPVLEVDWIDRARGTAEPIPFPPTNLQAPAEVVSLYRAVQQQNAVSEVTVNVDQDAT